MKFRIILLFLLAGVFIQLMGCGYNRTNLIEQANGPKEISIRLLSDPLMVAADLKSHLQNKGFDVDMWQLDKAVMNASNKQQRTGETAGRRYELLLIYHIHTNTRRISMVSASVIDYKVNKVLASWQSGKMGSRGDGLIANLDSKLLAPVFGYKIEGLDAEKTQIRRHLAMPGF